ncbi:MAG: folate-binding protein [Propionibacteriaceae bacterium]|jgi:folate-binding protein YgfZ|nr:folate-binding protein [Propionibacteriaceae bacterium]
MAEVLVPDGVDAGAPWHHGAPLAEQRHLDSDGIVDLARRDVLVITGADRRRHLHTLSTGDLADLKPGQAASAFFLDPAGHILFSFSLVETGTAIWGWTEPGQGEALAEHIDRLTFRLDVTATPRPDVALLWKAGPPPGDGEDSAARPADAGDPVEETTADGGAGIPDAGITRTGPDSLGGHEWFIPRQHLAARMTEGFPVGLWGWEARRIAAGIARVGLDTDARTIPNELGVPSPAVSLTKGCYPGQEVVARVHHLGRPPRRLVRLLFDGSDDAIPQPCTPLLRGEPGGEAVVGRLGSAAHHARLGLIGLALVKRDLPDDALLSLGSKEESDGAAEQGSAGMVCAIEPLVAADAGLHFRPDPDLVSPAPRRAGSLSLGMTTAGVAKPGITIQRGR